MYYFCETNRLRRACNGSSQKEYCYPVFVTLFIDITLLLVSVTKNYFKLDQCFLKLTNQTNFITHISIDCSWKSSFILIFNLPKIKLNWNRFTVIRRGWVMWSNPRGPPENVHKTIEPFLELVHANICIRRESLLI